MPMLTQTKQIQVHAGMVCDSCNKSDTDGANDFGVDHALASGTVRLARVRAAICDCCLVRLLVEKVPGATFHDADGNPIAAEDMLRSLEGSNGPAPLTLAA